MDNCETCKQVLPDFLFPAHFSRLTTPATEPPRLQRLALQSNLINGVFNNEITRNGNNGLSAALEPTVLNTTNPPQVELTETGAGSYYYRRQPNCFAVAVTSGMRGLVVGSVFGGAMGMLIYSLIGYIVFKKKYACGFANNRHSSLPNLQVCPPLCKVDTKALLHLHMLVRELFEMRSALEAGQPCMASLAVVAYAFAVAMTCSMRRRRVPSRVAYSP